MTSPANRKSKEEYDEEMSRRLLLEEDAASSSASASRREQPAVESGDGQNQNATSASTPRGDAAQVSRRAEPAGLNPLGGATKVWNLCSFTVLKVQCVKSGSI